MTQVGPIRINQTQGILFELLRKQIFFPKGLNPGNRQSWSCNRLSANKRRGQLRREQTWKTGLEMERNWILVMSPVWLSPAVAEARNIPGCFSYMSPQIAFYISHFSCIIFRPFQAKKCLTRHSSPFAIFPFSFISRPLGSIFQPRRDTQSSVAKFTSLPGICSLVLPVELENIGQSLLLLKLSSPLNFSTSYCFPLASLHFLFSFFLQIINLITIRVSYSSQSLNLHSFPV